MNKMSFYTIVVVLALGFAAMNSTVLAQNRPDCLAGGNAGACFVDGEVLNDLYLCGEWVNWGGAGPDENDNFILWTFPTSADDFIRVNGNGQTYLHLNDTQADLWVCPGTAGGIALLFEYFDTCVVPDGMLTGTGRLVGTGRFEEASGHCPHVAFTGAGTAQNPAGQSFDVKSIWILRPDPASPQTGPQCVEVMNKITIKMQ